MAGLLGVLPSVLAPGHRLPRPTFTTHIRPRLRKTAKHALSRATAAELLARNRFSHESILGTVPVVVSLTSYGRRIDRVAITIESIGRGAVRPARIILWLDDERRFAEQPSSLLALAERGLEVRLSRNYGPHTKYFPYLEHTAACGGLHRMPLVTADDDIMYPPHWLAVLWEAYCGHPRSVNCWWARTIGIVGDDLDNYSSWRTCTTTAPSLRHFALGVSGVVYPPALLDHLTDRGTGFQETCPKADDIWLHHAALETGTTVRQVTERGRHFPMIPGSQDQGLMQENVLGRGNDRCLAAMYTDNDVQFLRGLASDSEY